MSERALKALLLPFDQGLLEMPHPRRAFLIRADADPILSGHWKDLLLCEQTFKPAHDRLLAAGFAVTTRLEGEFDIGLVNLTKHKLENTANIGRGWGLLRPGGILVCAGDNDIGAASMERSVRDAIGLAGHLAKFHSRVFWITKSLEGAQPPAEWLARHQLHPNENGYQTEPGLFSYERIDRGSRLLAEQMPKTISGQVADFGAGWGYLSAELLKKYPAIDRLDLYEAELRALDAARCNIGPDPRAHFLWHDLYSRTPEERRYDWIVMNPPFHAGKNADMSLGRAFIAAAVASLHSRGSLLLVANHHLPYEAALAQHFEVNKLIEQDGFKVLLGTATR